jgi:hypothetical protein
MDIDYVFLCGVMWCRFGQKDAGEELLRASNSGDPALQALAWAMFTRRVRRLRESEKTDALLFSHDATRELCG